MISKLKRITRQLRRSKPGNRFVDHYHQNKHKNTNAWKRWLVIVLGVVMAMAGLVLSLPPGLDKLECAVRNLYHKIVKFFSGRRG
ncbi:MAG: hypothetical protein LC646_08725 [Xanthomonadaceae bacterium]|nr:hypothetical protein [Xanthomonadaceae bacterium]